MQTIADGASAEPSQEDSRRAGRPTMEDSLLLNERIVETAFQVFAREGFERATVEQIALEAATTRRSITSRFPDKEALLLAVVDVKMRGHVVDVVTTEALTSRHPLEALRATCLWILNAIDNDLLIAFYRLCIAEAAKLPPVSATFVRMNDRLEGDIQSLVERAQRAGAFSGQNSAGVAAALLGTFMSNPINRITTGDVRFRDTAFREDYFDRCWRLFAGA